MTLSIFSRIYWPPVYLLWSCTWFGKGMSSWSFSFLASEIDIIARWLNEVKELGSTIHSKHLTNAYPFTPLIWNILTYLGSTVIPRIPFPIWLWVWIDHRRHLWEIWETQWCSGHFMLWKVGIGHFVGLGQLCQCPLGLLLQRLQVLDRVPMISVAQCPLPLTGHPCHQSCMGEGFGFQRPWWIPADPCSPALHISFPSSLLVWLT